MPVCKPKQIRRCGHCKQVGHYRSRCPMIVDNKKETDKPSKIMPKAKLPTRQNSCSCCGKQGHNRRKCPVLMKSKKLIQEIPLYKPAEDMPKLSILPFLYHSNDSWEMVRNSNIDSTTWKQYILFQYSKHYTSSEIPFSKQRKLILTMYESFVSPDKDLFSILETYCTSTFPSNWKHVIFWKHMDTMIRYLRMDSKWNILCTHIQYFLTYNYHQPTKTIERLFIKKHKSKQKIIKEFSYYPKTQQLRITTCKRSSRNFFIRVKTYQNIDSLQNAQKMMYGLMNQDCQLHGFTVWNL